MDGGDLGVIKYVTKCYKDFLEILFDFNLIFHSQNILSLKFVNKIIYLHFKFLR